MLEELADRFGAGIDANDTGEPLGPSQKTCDGVPTQWVSTDRVRDVLRYLKLEAERPYRMLYDLTAIDERTRAYRDDQPASDFTVVYHLLSFERNADIRLKVALVEPDLAMPTITDIWPAANWYEREMWDMFGIVFDGHPHLRRILLPPTVAGPRRCARIIRRARRRWSRSACRKTRRRPSRRRCASIPKSGECGVP